MKLSDVSKKYNVEFDCKCETVEEHLRKEGFPSLADMIAVRRIED